MIILRDDNAKVVFNLYETICRREEIFGEYLGSIYSKGSLHEAYNTENLKAEARDLVKNVLPHFRRVAPKKLQRLIREDDFESLENSCEEILAI